MQGPETYPLVLHVLGISHNPAEEACVFRGMLVTAAPVHIRRSSRMLIDSFIGQVGGLHITAGVTQNYASSSEGLMLHTDMPATEFAKF